MSPEASPTDRLVLHAPDAWRHSLESTGPFGGRRQPSKSPWAATCRTKLMRLTTRDKGVTLPGRHRNRHLVKTAPIHIYRAADSWSRIDVVATPDRPTLPPRRSKVHRCSLGAKTPAPPLRVKGWTSSKPGAKAGDGAELAEATAKPTITVAAPRSGP